MITANPVADAARHYDRLERVGQARDGFIDTRADELVALLTSRPMQACVECFYGRETGQVPVAADMAGWINEQFSDAERALAEVMFSPLARGRYVRRYAEARAVDEADRKPVGYFDEECDE